MDFVITWLCNLAAFAAGSLIAWLIAVLTIKATTEEEALAGHRAADESGAR
jgi:uncharacterized membrane protein ArfB